MRVTSLLIAVAVGQLPSATVLAQRSEYVVVQKVNDDKAIVERANGDVFQIEKGVGCLSLWRFEGKRVVITSPGLFAGVGSQLVLPDLNQQCRIWDSKQVANAPAPTQPATSGSKAPLSIYSRDPDSLFDARGNAAAYLTTDTDTTFYLWSGEPAAYLSGESIFGFNGKHLGWYRGGIVYDSDGAVVAAPAAAFATPVAPAPPKGLRQLKPLKGLKELRPLKPLFSNSWSSTLAAVFFFGGTS